MAGFVLDYIFTMTFKKESIVLFMLKGKQLNIAKRATVSLITGLSHLPARAVFFFYPLKSVLEVFGFLSRISRLKSV